MQKAWLLYVNVQAYFDAWKRWPPTSKRTYSSQSYLKSAIRFCWITFDVLINFCNFLKLNFGNTTFSCKTADRLYAGTVVGYDFWRWNEKECVTVRASRQPGSISSDYFFYRYNT